MSQETVSDLLKWDSVERKWTLHILTVVDFFLVEAAAASCSTYDMNICYFAEITMSCKINWDFSILRILLNKLLLCLIIKKIYNKAKN